MSVVKTLSILVVIAVTASQALAQSPGPGSTQADQAQGASPGPETPTGHEINFGLGGYKYEEPGDLSISIYGPKLVGGYIGTLSLNKKQHWFAHADLRGAAGSVTYDGWCAPYVITPHNASPNGYALDIGEYSACSETGDSDWYVETRGLVGKDFVSRRWAFSPMTGLGFRFLSNGTTGVPGYRTQKYLYLPLGVTARTTLGSRSALSFSFEYDHLLHGWQTTSVSKLGGGDIPATPTTPPFTVNGFSDVSFDQDQGWAVRISGKYQVTPRWSVEPVYTHWNVSDSSVSSETATFTVNGVTASQQFFAYEPFNVTNEFVVRAGLRF
jgi:hypothetical protein